MCRGAAAQAAGEGPSGKSGGIHFFRDEVRGMPDIRDVDPQELRLPSSRRGGADWAKLQRQMIRFGASTSTMPPVWVREGSDGTLLILDGVTRATRIAKLAPGKLIRVEVVAASQQAFENLPRIGDHLP